MNSQQKHGDNPFTTPFDGTDDKPGEWEEWESEYGEDDSENENNNGAETSPRPSHSHTDPKPANAPSLAAPQARQKIPNGNAGIRVVTDMSVFHAQRQKLQPAPTDYDGRTGKFVDATALRALEGLPSSSSVGSWHWLRPQDSVKKSGSGPGPEQDLSPNDRPIMIGISLPEDGLAGRDTTPQTDSAAETPEDGRSAVYDSPPPPTQELPQRQKPQLLTVGHLPSPLVPQVRSVWSPDSEDSSPLSASLPPRAVSSIYSQAGLAIGPGSDVPPVPAVPQSYLGAGTTAATIMSADAADDAADDIGTPVTLFEEDGTSPLACRRQSSRARGHVRSLAVTINNNFNTRSGWWDHVKTPFAEQAMSPFLTRPPSAKTVSPMTPAFSRAPAEPSPSTPAVPAVAAHVETVVAVNPAAREAPVTTQTSTVREAYEAQSSQVHTTREVYHVHEIIREVPQAAPTPTNITIIQGSNVSRFDEAREPSQQELLASETRSTPMACGEEPAPAATAAAASAAPVASAAPIPAVPAAPAAPAAPAEFAAQKMHSSSVAPSAPPAASIRAAPAVPSTAQESSSHVTNATESHVTSAPVAPAVPAAFPAPVVPTTTIVAESTVHVTQPAPAAAPAPAVPAPVASSDPKVVVIVVPTGTGAPGMAMPHIATQIAAQAGQDDRDWWKTVTGEALQTMTGTSGTRSETRSASRDRSNRAPEGRTAVAREVSIGTLRTAETGTTRTATRTTVTTSETSTVSPTGSTFTTWPERPYQPGLAISSPMSSSTGRSGGATREARVAAGSASATTAAAREHRGSVASPPPYASPSLSDRSRRSGQQPPRPMHNHFPPSPGPASPGLAYTMTSQGAIPMSEVPLTPQAGHTPAAAAYYGTTGRSGAHSDRRAAEVYYGTSAPKQQRAGQLLPRVTTLMDRQRQRKMDEKEEADEAGLKDKKKGKKGKKLLWCIPVAVLCCCCMGREKEVQGDSEDPKQQKQEKKKGKWWKWKVALWILGLIVLIVLPIVLALELTKKKTATQEYSFWLNLTDYPPMPTGVTTVVGAANRETVDGCVEPATLWSCTLAKELQAAHAPLAADALSLILDIQYDNSSSRLWQVSPGPTPTPTTGSDTTTVTVAPTTTTTYDAGFTPSPAAPAFAEMWFLGNTTDGIVSGDKAGEATPFFISFLTALNSTVGPNMVTRRLRRAEGSRGDMRRDGGGDMKPRDISDASSSSSASSGSATTTSETSSASSTATSSSSATTSTTSTTSTKKTAMSTSSSTASASAPQDTAASTVTESSTTTSTSTTTAFPAAATNADGTGATAVLHPLPQQQPVRLFDRGLATEHYGFYTYFTKTIYVKSITAASAEDGDGGALEANADYIVTFLQTRFLVQIWTRAENTTQLVGGGGRTNTTQPSTFPYPITIIEDLHGGDFATKGNFARVVEDQYILNDNSTLLLDNLAFNGTLINHSDNISFGGSDGGTGGCKCVWGNYESV